MATYIAYQLEDGSTVLFAADDEDGFRQAGVGDTVKKAKKTFEEALAGVKPLMAALRRQLNDLKADEVEVMFGLKATGEAGNFAIGKVGTEANYEVTLKWSNKPAK